MTHKSEAGGTGVFSFPRSPWECRPRRSCVVPPTLILGPLRQSQAFEAEFPCRALCITRMPGGLEFVLISTVSLKRAFRTLRDGSMSQP